MGRPRTPTETLKLTGAYRGDRHGNRASEPKPGGSPVKPGGLSEAASQHWDFVVPLLAKTKVASRLDTCALQRMCEWWAEFERVRDEVPTEKTEYRRLNMMANASKQWRDLASRFGLTPTDRANIQVGEAESHDPAAEFIA